MGWEREGEVQTGAKLSARLSERFGVGFGYKSLKKKKGFSINKSVSKEFLQRYIKYDKSVAIKNTIKEIKLMSSPSLN